MTRRQHLTEPLELGTAGEAGRRSSRKRLSEYFLDTVGGRDTIPTGWAKQLLSLEVADVPIISYYKYEDEEWGDSVIRFYRFKNDKDSHLGNEPLPDGEVMAFRSVTADHLYALVGSLPT